eukprot:TRINITY_DN7706_c0_g1_i1.p1 TRINITY_DN7706_c0_g1~~TRINITY_DN7706_c0_g1_i1.p1  ORF type:complete len:615 (-),score=187.49 TRINITY_DN7706_c0_g1_i1:537-2381(-)
MPSMLSKALGVAAVAAAAVAEPEPAVVDAVFQDEPADEDFILPAVGDKSLPERLLVFVPGGLVPTVHYEPMLKEIQKKTTGLRLTIVMKPAFQRLCIIQCPSSSLCSTWHGQVQGLIDKSGFKVTNAKEQVFVAGHSLGATCANYMVQGYSYDYAGLMEFGGYIDMTGSGSLPEYAIPVLHMAGELDGGAARPGKLSYYYSQMRDYEKAHGTEEALTKKPVQVLEGLDHSDFCPGFFVTKVKDCKSEVDQDTALHRIAEGASAFLHLNSGAAADLKAAGLKTMKDMVPFTESMCEPYLKAFEYEKKGTAGPWCSQAQHLIAGLPSQDTEKLVIEGDDCHFVEGSLHDFEHFHTSYNVSADGHLKVSCGASKEDASNVLNTGGQVSAESVDCKMLDATRVGEQLKVKTDSTVSCADINKKAVELAESLLAPKSRKRYEEKGRKWCFKEDAQAPFNIGPLFVNGKIKFAETAQCMEVTSLGLISTVNSSIYPGNHYCKLLSPARAMDWMMTDSHKPFPYPSEAEDEAMLAALADDMETLYKIADGKCGQATLSKKYAPYAAKFAGLQEGKCADQGYTVSAGEKTINVPVLGKITVDTFTKPTVESVVDVALESILI